MRGRQSRYSRGMTIQSKLRKATAELDEAKSDVVDLATEFAIAVGVFSVIVSVVVASCGGM